MSRARWRRKLGLVLAAFGTLALAAFAAPAALAAELNVDGATVLSTTSVKVTFDATVDTSGEVTSNYSISPFLAVGHASRTNANNAVVLTVGPMLNGLLYWITVDGVSGTKGSMPRPESVTFIGTSQSVNSQSVGHDDFNRASGFLTSDTPVSGTWSVRHEDGGNDMSLVTSPSLTGTPGDWALRSYVSNTDAEADNAAVLHLLGGGAEYFTSAYVYVPSGQGWETDHAVGLLRVNQSEWSAHARISAFAESSTVYSLKVNFKSTGNAYYGEQLVMRGITFDAWHWFQMRVRNSTSSTKPGIIQVWVDGRLRYSHDSIYVAQKAITYAEAGIMHNVTTLTGPPSTTITDAWRLGAAYQLPSLLLDTTAPQAAVVAPVAGQPSRGTVDFTAGTSDDVDVLRAEFMLDGTRIATDDVPPFTIRLDTSTLTDGAHTFAVGATDTSGNAAASDVVTAPVDNTQATVALVGAAPTPFTPDGDGTDDTVVFSYSTVEPTLQHVTVTTPGGQEVATLRAWSLWGAGRQDVTWDGRRDDGTPADEGSYVLTAEVRDLVSPPLPANTVSTGITLVDGLAAVQADPTPFSPNADGVRDTTGIGYTLLADGAVTVVVEDGEGLAVRTLLDRVAQTDGARTVDWDGRDAEDALAPDGAYTVRVSVTTALGTTTGSTRVVLDTLPPESRSDALEGVWYTSLPSITLSADDEASAVTGTQYAIDEDGWSDFTAPVAVPEGVHTLRYRSTDEAGNVEEVRQAVLWIDQTPPQTTDNSDSEPRQSFTLMLTPADGGSGVAATEYRIDGGFWQSGTSVTLRIAIRHKRSGYTRGSHTIEYRSIDVAGNVESTRSCHVVLGG